MKKILSLILAAGITISVFATDIFTYAPLKGNIEAYKKTEYSIASKFGNYYRTPSVKFSHIFDAAGNEVESSELTPKEDTINTIVSTYDSLGNMLGQVSTTAEGELIWKSEITYKNNKKYAVSEFNSANELKAKTIYTYSFDRLVDESRYDGEGALVWKTIYTYNKDDQIDAISEYLPTGVLSEKYSYEYDENGRIKSISTLDSFSKISLQNVFRFDGNGLLNEITTYGPDKQICKRTIIKYDGRGNISKINTYDVAQKFGTIVQELSGMSDFEYRYNDSAVDSDTEAVTVVNDIYEK